MLVTLTTPSPPPAQHPPQDAPRRLTHQGEVPRGVLSSEKKEKEKPKHGRRAWCVASVWAWVHHSGLGEGVWTTLQEEGGSFLGRSHGLISAQLQARFPRACQQ